MITGIGKRYRKAVGRIVAAGLAKVGYRFEVVAIHATACFALVAGIIQYIVSEGADNKNDHRRSLPEQKQKACTWREIVLTNVRSVQQP
jgi:thiosulfate reductase cytochrome b subunit